MTDRPDKPQAAEANEIVIVEIGGKERAMLQNEAESDLSARILNEKELGELRLEVAVANEIRDQIQVLTAKGHSLKQEVGLLFEDSLMRETVYEPDPEADQTTPVSGMPLVERHSGSFPEVSSAYESPLNGDWGNTPPPADSSDSKAPAPDSSREELGLTSPSDPEGAKEYISARHSPLPAIPKFEPNCANRTLLESESKMEGVHWVAMLDLDKTFYEAESKHGIMLLQFARYIKEHHGGDFNQGNGNTEALDELIEHGDNWEDQMKKISQGRKVHDSMQYEEAILKAGNLSAGAFEGMSMKKLEEYGKEFVEKGMGGRFFGYTKPVIQKIKEHGILPVITTGLPDFLLAPILEKIGVSHGNGMSYKTNEDGILTGEIDVNMGVAEEKANYGKDLTRRGYAVAFAMGDSIGDMGLFKTAVNKSRAKEDISGAAVMINGSDSARNELKRTYSTDLKDGRVQMLGSGMADSIVIAAVEVALKKVFEPLHEYSEIQSNPERLQEYLEKLESRKGSGKKHPNLENLKRIRDALRSEGLTEEQVTQQLRAFYPVIIVQDVMKKGNINTGRPDELEAWLNELVEHGELTRDTVTAVLNANGMHQRKMQEEKGIHKKRRRAITPPRDRPAFVAPDSNVEPDQE